MFPLGPEEDAARLPVAVLSGFLGSGKTTLLNRLLADPRMANTAVAINEFGAVPLDQHLIDHGEDETVVMANGCLCCNVGGDMEDAVMRIFSRRAAGGLPHFDRMIVEPSGLADPAPIAQAILRQPALSRVMRLEAILTVVDGVFGPRQLDEHPEARRQAALADVLLVSKDDLADTAPLLRRLPAINPHAPVLAVRHGAADPAALFSPSFLDPARPASPVADWLERRAPSGIASGHHHGAAATAASLLADAPLRWAEFDRWLRRVRTTHGEDLLRVKGILRVAGRDRPVVVQGIHHVLHPPAELAAWPDADRRSRLVLIFREPALATAATASWAEALPGLTAAEAHA